MVQGPDEDPEWGGWLGAYWPQFDALRALRRAAFWARLMPQSEGHRLERDNAAAAWKAAVSRWRETLAGTLTGLGRRLWPSLDRMLRDAGCQRVLLVPQGMLFLLPLHACPINDDGGVAGRYTLAYAPACAVLPRLAGEDTTSHPGPALLVANPTGDLRHTPSEVLAIGETLAVAVTLWEREATQNEVISASRRAGILHFSGHGIYDWRDPERSGLILAAEGQAEGVAGPNLFTVAEMREQLQLARARLVTLSACETGLVAFRRGLADEYLGVPGILLQAGARAVVASLWAVDDLATALLIRQFYTEWQAGAISIATALQRAQRWLRTRTRSQVEEALDALDEAWEPWRHQHADAAMKRRAIDQYWEISEARQRLAGMDEIPFAHPYWWAAFQAVGDVL
jgi:CHAT domain-containing protein